MTGAAPTSSAVPRPAGAPSRTKLLVVMGIALVSISTSGPLVVASGMDKPALGFWRVLIAGSLQLLLAVAIERGALFAIGPRDLARVCLSGSILGIHYLTWFLSLEYTTVASSTVLATTNPLWVAIGAWIFLGEKVSRTTWAAIAIGIVGAAILAFADSTSAGKATNPLLGDALALAGALTSSATLLIARAVRARVPAATYASVQSLSSAPVLFLSAILFGSNFVPVDARQATLALGVALIPHLVGNTALNWGLGWLPAPRIALVILGEPVGATVLAWIFLHQRPGALTLAGAALVLTAVTLSLRQPARPAAA